jgi:hypothetical protein
VSGQTYSKGASRGQMISPRQIKIIHTLVSTLGMDRESYVVLLQQVADDVKVTSSKQLTWRQAESLVDELQAKKGGSPSPAPPVRAKPFADMDGRPGMASGAQLRMVAAMWGEVSRAENAADRAKALDRFIKKIAGVESIRFVKSFQVEKLVKALDKMKESKEAGDVENSDDVV